MVKKKNHKIPEQVDIVIAGGGYAGLACSVSIKQSAPDLCILVVDPAPEKNIQNDARASAIAADASRMLDQLGLWEGLVENAQPVTDMIVTDSRTSDVVRPVFLTFANERNDNTPFAHMIENRSMIAALREKADALGVMRSDCCGVEDFENQGAENKISLTSGQTIFARMLIACDGVRSQLRAKAGIKTLNWQYDQKGIVCTVEHERPHNGRAQEHFLPAGPFAILPLKGNRSSLVWTERSKDADRLLEEDELVFESELEQRFGHQLGEISVLGKVQAFPLGLTLAREFVRPRLALAGDAAHGIHPIAGQGLNLGFKDAAALAETIVEAHRLGQDIGSIDVLERYQMWRRFDTVQMGIVTDVLNRLFSNDNQMIRGMRDVGLGLVDRMPALKRFLIGEASHSHTTAPRLLRGEPL